MLYSFLWLSMTTVNPQGYPMAQLRGLPSYGVHIVIMTNDTDRVITRSHDMWLLWKKHMACQTVYTVGLYSKKLPRYYMYEFITTLPVCITVEWHFLSAVF